MTPSGHAVLTALVFSLATGCASTEVLDSSAGGLTVKTTLTLPVPLAIIYERGMNWRPFMNARTAA
jgi:hypothetical protein